MALLDTEAIVLRTYNLGEADKIVVCLTRGAGLVRAVARGCRKLRHDENPQAEGSVRL